MTTSLIDVDSFLVVDVGSISTRAILFDVVDGRYRFVASGTVPSTADAPYRSVSEGVRMAIDRLQNITGRILIGADEQLIIPSAPDGSGVDKFAATISAGPPLKVVVIGLLEDVSLESARRLAATTYARVMHTISLNDRRKVDARINAIVRLCPDLVVVAGGTDHGASQSVLKLLEAVGLACYLLPEGRRPDVLFVGNQDAKQDVQSTLEGLTQLHFAPNIRPTLEVEQLDAAQTQMAKIFGSIRSRQIAGVEDLNSWAGGGLISTAAAFGRIIRFIGKEHTTKKGALGIDVGASATTVAAAFDGDLTLGVYPQFGLGSGMAELLDYVALDDVVQWVGNAETSSDDVREYIANKVLYPASLPVTEQEMEIEQSIVRQVMRASVRMISRSLPAQAVSVGEGLLPWVEPIVATGSVLTQAPNQAQCALMLLDGLQPAGVTTLVLDQNHIFPALGAAAAVSPVLTVQVLDSNSFLHLGTVVAPVGHARPGTPVLRLKIIYESGHETTLEVKQGSLEVLPLPYGQAARLHLQPLHRFDVGMGAPGRGGGLRVLGGTLGLVIDARGRPFKPPDDRGKRQELFKKWLWTLGGR
ncbi:MAG: glutamate mutase L [Anaerolineales bacterium]|nr:glutamate mutase L [Anaerolineales bacterium]